MEKGVPGGGVAQVGVGHGTPHLRRSPEKGGEYNNINAVKICACLTGVVYVYLLGTYHLISDVRLSTPLLAPCI